MVDYNPPTENLPIFDKLVFSQADASITQSQADKRYLRYPNAQGTENLSTTNINGVLTAKSTSNFNDILTMTNTDSSKREIRTSYLKLLDSGNDINKNTIIVHNGTNTDIICVVFFGAINFRVFNNLGQQSVPVIIDATNTLISNNLRATSTSEFKRVISLNDITDANNRKIISTFFEFYDAGSLPLSTIGTIYNQSGAMYIQNYFNGGSISLVCDDAGGNQFSPLQVTGTSVLLNKNTTIAANTNLTMNAGNGIISQPYANNDISTRNSFKLADFRFHSGSATGTATAFEFYDDFNAKGLFLLPNSGSGSLSQTNRQNDCCLTSRATQNNNTITVSNWNSNMRNGLRVSTTDINNCSTTILCGQSDSNDWTEFKMAYNRSTLTTTSTFNNVINFNPSTPLAIASTRRKLEGLGTLSFTDIIGGSSTGTITSSIYTDSIAVDSATGMYFKCGINDGFHTFASKDSSGTDVIPMQIKPTEIKMNRTIKFDTAGLSADRDIIGVGAIVMVDTFGGGTSSSIQSTTNTGEPIPGMIYDCNINGGFHIFKCNDSLGNETSPIYYGSNLTSVSNTFVIRNATTTSNRFDILVDGSQVTSIRARSTTASTSAIVDINCDSVSALGVVTNNAVLTIAPTYVELKRPIQFDYSTIPNDTTQLGYIISPVLIPAANITSSANIKKFGNFTITNAGSYTINVLITMLTNLNVTLNENRWCLNTTASTFPSITTPTKTTPSIIGGHGTLLITTVTSYLNINLSVTVTAGEIFYINYFLNYTGTASISASVIYSYARIG